MLEPANGKNADLQLYKQKITDEIATVINSKKQNIYCLFIPYLTFSWFMRHDFRLYGCQRDFQRGSSPPTLNDHFTKALSQVPYSYIFLNKLWPLTLPLPTSPTLQCSTHHPRLRSLKFSLAYRHCPFLGTTRRQKGEEKITMKTRICTNFSIAELVPKSKPVSVDMIRAYR